MGIFYILKYCSFHSGALTAVKGARKSAHLIKAFIKKPSNESAENQEIMLGDLALFANRVSIFSDSQ